MEEKRNKILQIASEISAIKKEMLNMNHAIINVEINRHHTEIQILDKDMYLYLLGDKEDAITQSTGFLRRSFFVNDVEILYVSVNDEYSFDRAADELSFDSKEEE